MTDSEKADYIIRLKLKTLHSALRSFISRQGDMPFSACPLFQRYRIFCVTGPAADAGKILTFKGPFPMPPPAQAVPACPGYPPDPYSLRRRRYRRPYSPDVKEAPHNKLLPEQNYFPCFLLPPSVRGIIFSDFHSPDCILPPLTGGQMRISIVR